LKKAPPLVASPQQKASPASPASTSPVQSPQQQQNTPSVSLAPIPFATLGRWLVHVVHSIFNDQRDTLRQLVAGMRRHIAQTRRAYNEHRKYLRLNEELEKVLPKHLYQLIRRMNQLFAFREKIYLRGTNSLSQYLTLMVNRANTLAGALVAQETHLKKTLADWTHVLEKDRDTLVGRVKQAADCADPASKMSFQLAPQTTQRQLAHLLDQGKTLFDKIEELRVHRTKAIVGGDRHLVKEIEAYLRRALSQAHAITGARQYFYTSQDAPTLFQFKTNEAQLKDRLARLLTLPRLYYNDYELAARQFQATINENIGGLRLFATLRMRQEFACAASELEDELCAQLLVVFEKIQQELNLLNGELDVLNTEFLAEFARARLAEELREQTARYIKAMYVASECTLARLDEQFLTLATSALKKRASQDEATDIALPALGVGAADLTKLLGPKPSPNPPAKKASAKSPAKSPVTSPSQPPSSLDQTVSSGHSDQESDVESETESTADGSLTN
jgi:hypothetical protein